MNKENQLKIQAQINTQNEIEKCFTKALLYDKNTYLNINKEEKRILFSMWKTALKGYNPEQIKKGFNYVLKQNNYQIKPSSIANYIDEQRHFQIEEEKFYKIDKFNKCDQTKEEYDMINKSNELMFAKSKRELNSDEQSYLDDCYKTKSWREW